MAEPIHFAPGNYSYLTGGFQYCAAIRADEGYMLERARFDKLVPVAEGFERIRRHLVAIGRPLTALGACELRSPAQMSEPDFIAFNRRYVRTLEDWGLFKDDINPVGRCNLAPAIDPPTEACFYAFTYTVRATQVMKTCDFITSGAAECPDRPGYREFITRLGETSPDALTDKLRFALGDIEARLKPLQLWWPDVTRMNLYTVHDLHHALASEVVARGAMSGGLNTHWVRPPVLDIEIEIDASRVSREILLPA